jgi:hypothetical protein
MKITINIARKHVVILVGCLLVLSGTRIAEATVFARSANKLCVTKSGAVFARSACKPNESKFNTMPGSVKKKKLTAKILGSQTLSSQESLTASTNSAFVSSLSILSNTPRVYTQLVTIPKGTPISMTNLIYSKNNGIPFCPSDAPIKYSSNFTLVELDSSSDYRVSDGFDGQYFFREKTADQGDWILWLSFNEYTSASNVTIELIGRPNGESTDTVIDETPFDISAYVSVTCIPTVQLVP